VAELDGAGVEGFKQRRPGGEFLPLYLVAERGKSAFKSASALQQNEIAVFLKADADDFVLCRRGSGKSPMSEPRRAITARVGDTLMRVPFEDKNCAGFG